MKPKKQIDITPVYVRIIDSVAAGVTGMVGYASTMYGNDEDGWQYNVFLKNKAELLDSNEVFPHKMNVEIITEEEYQKSER